MSVGGPEKAGSSGLFRRGVAAAAISVFLLASAAAQRYGTAETAFMVVAE
jgi:hypothetical protein